MTIIPNSEVRLLTSVPLNIKMEHQMDFASLSEQYSYFNSKSSGSLTFDNLTYQRDTGTIKVPKGYDSLYNCNYIMYRNKDFSTKWFYAFITDKEYINPNTTAIHFQLDPWQTWQFDIDFKPSFIEREHTDRWNSDGSPVINTVDEQLDYGSEYETVSAEWVVPNQQYKWLVIIAKKPIETTNTDVYSTVIGTPQPLSYYVVPFRDDDKTINVILEGQGDTIPMTPPTRIMEEMYKDEGAVNNVVSIYVTEYIGVPATYQDNGEFPDTLTLPNNSATSFREVVFGEGVTVLGVNRIEQFESMEFNQGDKYDGFAEVDESKLLMYPYCVTIIDDFKGNRIEIKNEYVNDKELKLRLKGSLGLSNRTTWSLANYNYSGPVGFMDHLSNETALINNDPNDVPILNDYLSAFLQGNRNSLQTQKASILFNGTLGSGGAIMGAVGGAMVGGPIGAVAGAGLGLTQSIGSTYLQIKQMASKIKDINNTPPQLAKMGFNTAYDFGNGYNGVWVIKKQIKPEYRKKLSDFFKMYGYKVHEVKRPNLRTRAHYNFIKTIGANITGNIPSEDLNLIIEMFNNGVTLWHTSDVGNYNLSNYEV